jgi:hypothetical protein
LADDIIWNRQIPHEFIHFLTDMSAWLPTAFESAIETVITHSIACVHNESAALTFVITTNCIEPNPSTGGVFAFAGQVI